MANWTNTVGYLNYRSYLTLHSGDYIKLVTTERHLPSIIYGMIITPADGRGKMLQIRLVQFPDEFEDRMSIIVLCDGEGTSDCEITVIDEVQYRIGNSNID